MLVASLTNSFRIHPMASLSFAAFLSAGTCECIISKWHFVKLSHPQKGDCDNQVVLGDCDNQVVLG